MQNGHYRWHSVDKNFETNILDVKILAGVGDTWQVFFA